MHADCEGNYEIIFIKYMASLLTVAVVSNIICFAGARVSSAGITANTSIKTWRWLAEITFCKIINKEIRVLDTQIEQLQNKLHKLLPKARATTHNTRCRTRDSLPRVKTNRTKNYFINWCLPNQNNSQWLLTNLRACWYGYL
jgi:hypothetical protein